MSKVDENNIGACNIRDFFEHHEIAILMLDFSLLFLIKLSFLISIASFLDCSNKSRNNFCKSRNCIGSNTEKKPWTNIHNWLIQKMKHIHKKKIRYCYQNIRKITITLKYISHFGCTNTASTDCVYILAYDKETTVFQSNI